jgi:hypothetical protein
MWTWQQVGRSHKIKEGLGCFYGRLGAMLCTHLSPQYHTEGIALPSQPVMLPVTQ